MIPADTKWTIGPLFDKAFVRSNLYNRIVTSKVFIWYFDCRFQSKFAVRSVTKKYGGEN